MSESHVLLQEAVKLYVLLKFCWKKVLFQFAKEKCFSLLVSWWTGHLHSFFRGKDLSSTITLKKSSCVLGSFTKTSKNAVYLGYKYVGEYHQEDILVVREHELFLFSKASGRFAAVLSGDCASGRCRDWLWAAQHDLWARWQWLHHLKEVELGWVGLCLYPRRA